MAILKYGDWVRFYWAPTDCWLIGRVDEPLEDGRVIINGRVYRPEQVKAL